MIADALDRLGDEQNFQRMGDGARVFHHEGDELAQDGSKLLVDLLIALYDRSLIPFLGDVLSRFQPSGGAFGSAFDVRGMSYLMFGLLLYVTVWARATRHR